MLLHHSIKPVLVFDGRNLPSKAGTEKKRRSKRFGQSLIPSFPLSWALKALFATFNQAMKLL